MPKVSVIVPNYNHARYLHGRMTSILHQTFSDFDVLLMDDCSTDNSGEVIESIASKDTRIRVLLNDTNSGSGYRQWNKGVAQTSGQYVWIAESDDTAQPELLESLVACLDADPTIGVAYCQSERIDEAGGVVGSFLDWTSDLGTDRWERDFVADGTQECRQYLCRKNTVPNASGVVFRRDVFCAAGGAVIDLRLCADWLLWATMLHRSKIAFVAKSLNGFRVSTGSVTQNSKKDGTIALESYIVARRIEKLTGIAPESLEPARATMYHVWTYPQRRQNVRISPQLNARIYGEARRFDPHLHRRFFGDCMGVVRSLWNRELRSAR